MKYLISSLLLLCFCSTIHSQIDFKLTPYLSFERTIPFGSFAHNKTITDGYAVNGFNTNFGINATLYKGFGIVGELSGSNYNRDLHNHSFTKLVASFKNNPDFQLNNRPMLASTRHLGNKSIDFSFSRIGLSYSSKVKRFGFFGAVKFGSLNVIGSKTARNSPFRSDGEPLIFQGVNNLYTYSTEDGFDGQTYTTQPYGGWSGGIDLMVKYYFKENGRFHIFGGLSADFGEFKVGHSEKITDWRIPSNNRETHTVRKLSFISPGIKVGIAFDIF